MSAIKKVWVTKHEGELVSISFESETLEPKWMRLHIAEADFPDKASKKYPKRHTLCLKLLSEDDLQAISDTINDYLNQEE